MNNKRTRALAGAATTWLMVLAAVFSYAPAGDAALPQEKLKPEEIVAKHLASVGAEETRKSIETRVIQGTANVTFRAPSIGQASGQVVMASQGNKHMMGMAFDNTGYPQERLGFDGDATTAGYIKPGQRSNLGEFLLTHKAIMKQGLLGGVLSEAWPLYDLEDKKPKLEGGGTKKIGDRTAYEIKYSPRGGSDARITLYFDAETFHHLRTEYTRTISAQMTNNPEASAGQRETRYKMTEDFSDFKKEGGLTLPHTYLIKVEFDTRGGAYQAQWEFKLSQFAYNQSIEPSSFNMGTE